MKYTEPHKSEMIVTLEALVSINKRSIDEHMRSVELLLQENEDTIKRIERIRNDEEDPTNGRQNEEN